MTDRPDAVDVFTSLPTAERTALEIRSWGRDAGYRRMFAERWRRQLGIDPGLVEAVASLPADGFLAEATRLLEGALPSMDAVVERLRKARIAHAIVHGPLPVDVPYANDATAALVARAPELLSGFARVDPTGGVAAAEEVVRGVTELRLAGVTISPFWHGMRCTDARARPLFEAAAELGVPVWVHSSVNWNRSRPLDLEHPRELDRLAGELPDLTLIAGHGGWPYVQELVAVAWRHPNVYIDVSAFRPRHLFRAGSGWEPLVYYGERTVSDKLLLGTTWALLGHEPAELLAEAWQAPWPEAVRRKWLGANASRVLGLDGGRADP